MERLIAYGSRDRRQMHIEHRSCAAHAALDDRAGTTMTILNSSIRDKAAVTVTRLANTKGALANSASVRASAAVRC